MANRQQVGNGLWLDNDYDEASNRRWLTARYVGTLAGDEIVDRVLDLSYGYDPVGNVTAISDALFGEAHTYAYDHRDRLTDWWIDGVLQQHYAYDQIGNIISFAGVTYSYPNPGQPRPHAVTGTTVGGSFGYNAAGYMTSRRDATGLPTYSYTWWPNHKLKKVTSNASNDQTLFYYGPDEERVRKLVDTPGSGTRDYNTWTIFPWYQLEKGCFRADVDCDGDVDVLDIQKVASKFNTTYTAYEQDGTNPISVTDITLVAEKWLWEGAGSAQQVVKTYSLGGRTVAIRRGSELTYVFQDHLGSPALETDATGNALTRFRYEPYGTMRGTEWTLPIDRGFTGQVIERGLGLHDYVARHYAQPLGRWIAPDTVVPEPGNPQALNRYTYVYNNPVRYTDPTGHCPWCIPVAIGVLKLVDYGWTAWDVYQSSRTLNDPNASSLDRQLAELNIILALSLEAGEPDDILPVAVPADDVARRGLIRAAREALAAGDEAALRNLPDWMRPIVRGLATEDRMLAQLGRQGQKRLLEVRLGEEVVRIIPDYVDDKVIGEIKDVAYLSAEKQIRAQIKYAVEHELIYELHIRPDTKLSKDLLKLLKEHGFKPIRDVIMP